MPPVGFEPVILSGERPQIYALNLLIVNVINLLHVGDELFHAFGETLQS
jgi:hypothetical protein